ncbi:MAG: HEAT repeat domain-containing protein [Candidatus Kariarchaeaceae archaeon]|jgi:hypothetical protein
MSQYTINLHDLQEAVVGVPQDLILPESHVDKNRDLKQESIRRIVDMYSLCRNNNRIYKSTYDALNDSNPFVRAAAADLIARSGTKNSFDYLFKALEDEENSTVKREIAKAINVLEARINRSYVKTQEVSFMKSMRLLANSD